MSELPGRLAKPLMTDGYVQFWTLGDPGDDNQKAAVLRAAAAGLDMGGKIPVHRTRMETIRDEWGNPVRWAPRYYFSAAAKLDLDEKIEVGRAQCLESKSLGFTIHADDGSQLRDLELTNIWGEEIVTND